MDLCGRCPVLGSNREDDLSTRVFKKKQLSYSALDLSFIAPSRWLAELAAASPLGRGRLVRVIPNTLDRSIFAPTNARAYRARLGLPETGYVIAFAAMGGASDPRKGFDLLVGALPRVATLLAPKSIHVLVIGGSAAMVPPKNGITVRGTGHLDTDKAVAEVLNAVDVLVAPSRQDNLPNTVMEALSCGLPCVAFDVGGMPDLIDHKQNGYLAQPFDTSDLAHGIAWVIEDSERYDGLRHAARDSTRRFDPVSVATQHIALYREIVERHRGATSA
jgi:glycosyltransferase involved in cell wall biosynthesis